MGALKKIPKWGWVVGGVSLALVALLLYEHYHNAGEDEPEPEPAPVEAAHPNQMSVPSGAAGGTNYYLPFPNGNGAQGAQDALPEEASEGEEELPEEKDNEPVPENTPAPVNPVTILPPGTPVPGSGTGSQGGLNTAIPAPPGGGSGTVNGHYVGVSPAQPVPAPAPFQQAPPVPAPRPAPVAVAPAIPAPAPCGCGCQHPNAVFTGNGCVNGGVGGHSAPPGYHLFCCDGGIWRAPN